MIDIYIYIYIYIYRIFCDDMSSDLPIVITLNVFSKQLQVESPFLISRSCSKSVAAEWACVQG